jgi:hypothetical protein
MPRRHGAKGLRRQGSPLRRRGHQLKPASVHVAAHHTCPAFSVASDAGPLTTWEPWATDSAFGALADRDLIQAEERGPTATRTSA